MTTQDEFARRPQQRPDTGRDAATGRSGIRSEYGLRPHRHVGGRFWGSRPQRQSAHDGDGQPLRTRAAGRADHYQHRPAQSTLGVAAPAVTTLTGRVAVVMDWVSQLERRLAGVMRRGSVPALRIALALVFVWFGALKVTGESPVGNLVAGVAPWIPRDLFISGLGAFEVLLGLALLFGYRLVWVALLMVAHLTGTFLVFVAEPAAAFSHGNPLLVTMAGEFVAKNMVLIAAGLVLVAFAHEHPSPVPEPA